MLLKKSIERLEKSKEFLQFTKENPDHYLAHAFTIIDKVQQDWQVGYYGEETEKVVVFQIGKMITQFPEEEVFKKPGSRVKKLELKKVKVKLEEAIDIADRLMKEKYSAEAITQTIVILQHLETQIYNITIVTKSMNIINMKIDAASGKIKKEFRQSIMGLKKEE